MAVIVYSKANCPACVKLKNELVVRAVEFEEVRVDIDTDARHFLLGEGHRSVPQVYKDGVHVKDPVNTLSNEINE